MAYHGPQKSPKKYSKFLKIPKAITHLSTWIPEVPRKTEKGTSGSARHQIVLRIQSEANILILGYSVIG